MGSRSIIGRRLLQADCCKQRLAHAPHVAAATGLPQELVLLLEQAHKGPPHSAPLMQARLHRYAWHQRMELAQSAQDGSLHVLWQGRSVGGGGAVGR
jgi:hypothetical protein